MKARLLLASLFILPALGCDQGVGDDDFRDLTLSREVGAGAAEVNWEDHEDLVEDPHLAYVEAMDIDNGAAYQTTCGARQVGSSWVEPGCYVCMCDEPGEASCWSATCSAPNSWK